MKRIYKASPDLEKAKRAGNRKKENLRINVSKVTTTQKSNYLGIVLIVSSSERWKYRLI